MVCEGNRLKFTWMDICRLYLQNVNKTLFFFLSNTAQPLQQHQIELNCFDHHYFNGASDALKQPQLHFHSSSILKTLNNSQKVFEHKGIRYKLYRWTAEQLLRKRLAGIPSSSDIDVLLRLLEPHPDTQGFNEAAKLQASISNDLNCWLQFLLV